MTRFSYLQIEPLPDGRREVRRLLEFLDSCGYEGIELDLASAAGRLTELADELARTGLRVPAFLTGAAYQEGLCLCSPDADVRRRTVERLVSYLPTARTFGAILVVGLLQGMRTDESDTAVANARITAALQEVGKAAAAQGVELVLEPVNHLQVGFNHTVAEVRRLLAEIGSPAIKPMVDTLHLNIEEQSLDQPILECGAQLRHVHLCESNGSTFGSGHLDFGLVLDALQRLDYDGFASVKVYRNAHWREAAPACLAYLRARRSTGGPAGRRPGDLP